MSREDERCFIHCTCSWTPETVCNKNTVLQYWQHLARLLIQETNPDKTDVFLKMEVNLCIIKHILEVFISLPLFNFLKNLVVYFILLNYYSKVEELKPRTKSTIYLSISTASQEALVSHMLRPLSIASEVGGVVKKSIPISLKILVAGLL